jgi:ligand-binding sensor domain-containing protein/AraC-like DNA-binding protein
MMKSWRKVLLIAVAVLCGCAVCGAQNTMLMNHLTIRDGLAGESVFKIFKDRNGMIWLGTTDGLSCFDGATLKTFPVDLRKQKCTVQDIVQMADGTLYAATYGGLFRKAPDKFSFVRMCPEISVAVYALAASGNLLYMGTENGLYVFDGTKLGHYLCDANILSSANRICDIFIDKRQRVWMATYGGLARFDTQRQRVLRYPIAKEMSIMGGWSSVVAIGDRVFLGTTNDGLFCYDVQKKHFAHYVDVGCNLIRELSTDQRDKLYVATDGGGVQVVSVSAGRIVQSFTTSTEPYNLPDNTVYSFLHDASGVDWFGQYRQGIVYTYYTNPIFRPYTFGTFTTAGLNVRSFCINGSQKLIGTRKGLYLVDERRNVVRYYPPAELGGSIVTSVAELGGRYYITTFDGGVRVLDGTTLQLMPIASGEAVFRKGSFFYATAYKGRIWFASIMGVYCFNPSNNSTESYTSSNSGMPDAYCNHLLPDRSGKLWVCTQKGLCLLDPATRAVRTSGFPEGFFDKLPAIHMSDRIGDGVLGYSEEGLFQSNTDMTSFGKIEINPKVFSESCLFVEGDANGRYWMATEHGLFYFDKAFKNFVQFGNMDGLYATEYSTVACNVDAQGHVWIGTTSGLFEADTHNILKRHLRASAPVIATDLRVNGQVLDDDAAQQFIGRQSLWLPWNFASAVCTFRLILLNYVNPHDIYYEYRMDNGEWNVATDKEIITLSTLLPGSHTLSVRLAGAEGGETSYKLYVYPDLAFFFEMVGLLSILYFIVYFVRNRKSIGKSLARGGEGKYSRVRIDTVASEEIMQKLDAYLRTEKPYLNPNLKLSEVAAAIGCTDSRLSQALSLYAKINYYDYVNRYRLEEFKRRVAEEGSSRYTLTALAEQCGFKHTTFFSTFKRETGMTPTEYVQQLNAERAGKK